MTLLIAVLPYLLLSAGLISTLALFASLKLEMRRNEQRSQRRIEELTVRLAAAERAANTAPAPPRTGFNLNRRVQALRMLRRGEDAAHVAAALSVPHKEVELLIRVQSIGRAWAANGGSG
ncbi:MAG TPA: hypothetical protein VMT15_20570 [Bryobacteraceae bacterium]|nr:hypothetical protein [Bryobacteraceae bacterium]